MKVLTAAEMREVDRRTIELGTPGLTLMENAASGLADFLTTRFDDTAPRRMVIVCGKGNNGGDGLAAARLLRARGLRPAVVLAADPGELRGDAAVNYSRLLESGGEIRQEIPDEARDAGIVVDALLGTGLSGPPSPGASRWIGEINRGFPHAAIVAVDIPSGMSSDSGSSPGEHVRASCTVTFTAPKLGMVLPPNCDYTGEIVVCPVGSPAELLAEATAELSEARDFAGLFQPRRRDSHKGGYGHVLVIGGSRGKSGAAAMAGIAALRAGAGLTTVAAPRSLLNSITAHAPELMTEALEETDTGGISWLSLATLNTLFQRKSVVAIGPGLGTHHQTVDITRRLVEESELPLVIDADALNALAHGGLEARGRLRVLTPHPGEMSRLTGAPVDAIQADRVGAARAFAAQSGAIVVLKGYRTVLAFPGGRVAINPTGGPAMAKGGSGDVLTGLIAGLVAQFPEQAPLAVRAAVWLHGRSADLATERWGDKCLLATDVFQTLPEAMRECRAV
ncbi:MAG: NAD(P)H-hydrate dehydratase [Bryobacteraceae bacterium]|nr:NAD(P)H-hydrate dehydratase [Bryobacteraceae bacterium]